MISEADLVRKIQERQTKGELLPTKDMQEQLARMNATKHKVEAPHYQPSNYKKQNYSVPFVSDSDL